VTSKLGEGTAFKVYLPQVSAAAPETEPPAAIAPSTRGCETILVVEDEDALRGLVERILGASGYKILTASTGPEAMDVAGDPRALSTYW
jgi:two-component system cell cycle sensor histidine kinase/response regulator CckA